MLSCNKPELIGRVSQFIESKRTDYVDREWLAVRAILRGTPCADG